MELFVASAEVDEWDVHDGAKHHEKDGVEVLNLKVVHNWSDHKIDTDDQYEGWEQIGNQSDF